MACNIFYFLQSYVIILTSGGMEEEKSHIFIISKVYKYQWESKGVSFLEQVYPPSMDRVTREIEKNVKKNKDLSKIYEVYKSVLAVQLQYMDRIEKIISIEADPDELKDLLRNGTFILSGYTLNMEGKLYKELVQAICGAIKEASAEAPDNLLNLHTAEEFAEGANLQTFIKDIAKLNKQDLQDYLENTEMDKRTGLDSEVLSFVLVMALSTFYSLYMKKVREKIDFTLWRKGHCPVCGQVASFARHRGEDGARVLLCWLCHAEWVFPRLECPYCGNKEQKQLRFFYLPGEKARQVHVCEVCNKYLKTVDGKALEGDVLLDVEAIASGYLDDLAEKEGYKRPDDMTQMH